LVESSNDAVADLQYKPIHATSAGAPNGCRFDARAWIVSVRRIGPLIAVILLVIAAVLVLGKRAQWSHRCEVPWPRLEAAPLPEDLSRFDPESAALFQQSVAAIGVAPDNVEAWFRFGMIYQAHTEDELARACYRTSLALQCENPKAWYYLAMVDARLGSPDDALQEIARVIKQAPEYAPAHWRAALWCLEAGDLAASERFARQAVQVAPADRSSNLVLGRVLVQAQRFLEAVDVLVPVVRQFDADAYGHFLLASAYRGAGRPNDAALEMAKGRDAQPRWDDPWEREMLRHFVGFRARFQMALELLNSSDPTRSVSLFEALRRERAEDHDVLVNLALAYGRAGRIDDAIAVLIDVERLHPDSSVVQLQFAATLHQRAMVQSVEEAGITRDQALIHVQRAVELSPTMAQANGQLGEILMFQGQNDAAADAFQRALELDAGNENWLVRLAGVRALQQRWVNVLQLLHEYANKPTRNVDALHLLAAALANTRQLLSAEAVILRGLAINPSDPRLVEALPRVRAAMAAAAETTTRPAETQP
jgi:tetratricopeptide (TPR) repeat protein